MSAVVPSQRREMQEAAPYAMTLEASIPRAVLKLRKANDDTPMRIRELAAYMTLGKDSIYADVKAGYRFEFATKRLTTPGHYKAWLRAQATEHSAENRDDQERQQRELRRLRSAAGKSRESLSSRGSQTP
ncbi:MAG: hypothetical protein QOE70_5330 [Chthoniobacter sp.]|nr:hypothetical protein [Chthoniobacter sp.]